MSWIPKILKGGRKPTALEILSSAQWHCASCDAPHEGRFAVAAFAPDPWPGGDGYEENGAIRFDGDFLSEDFCVLDGQYFMVRACLDIPVHGMGTPFSFGAWSTLSRENFDKYLTGFDDGEYPDMGPWSGWLCNQLEDYVGNDPLAVWVVPQADRQRPKLYVMNDDHPLAIDQDHGISPDRVLDIYEYYGHRPSELG
ncbi:DUF2199 domain-containing protein [Sphingopyxis sp.]|uniref:DUF2199 domain-containing protein n=1 Tax=Sphingopyxis sp. TaxID=1908224 RepID=UPI002D7E790C|nr:DUF2199 domain-containing protein [Sphingopyxis sp.]